MVTRLKGKPEIPYPCSWNYKLFGTDQDSIREAVAQTIIGCDYSLTPSRSSSQGKYHCMNLDIVVMNEEDRVGIFQALSSHPSFVLVL